MVALPQEDRIARAVFEQYERSARPEQRGHLGASIIGSPCDRRLWYTFRWAYRRSEKFDGRMLRLLDHGKREEERIVDDLRSIGCEVHADDGKGEQFSFSEHGGHYAGSIDGAVRRVPEADKTWHVLEMKTHNDKSFNDLAKNGVAKSKPEHFAQMQAYMRWTGMKRALYFAVNKNTDAIYTERIHYEKDRAEGLAKRALRVIQSDDAPDRISNDPSWYECKLCDAHEICHEGKASPRNCRTCVHATPELGGDQRWTCQRFGVDLPFENQQRGCHAHLPIPDLVPYAQCVDAGDDYLIFETEDGERFAVVGELGFPAEDVPHFSSDELEHLTPETIASAHAVKSSFEGAKVTGGRKK